MTTITVQRALLEQALEALEIATDNYDDSAIGLEVEAIFALRDALAAPATAPAQPAWRDAPTVPGLWVCDYFGEEISVTEFNDHEVKHFDIDEMKGCRWYGPIPEDKQ